MKKALIVKCIMLTVLLALMIPLSISFISGRGLLFSMNWNSKSSGTELIANSKFENITELSVGMVEEEIRILEHNQDYVLVKFFGNKDHNPLVEVKGGRLTIEHKQQKWNLFNFNFDSNSDQYIEIYIPVNSLSEISLGTVSGKINVDAVSTDLSADTISGSIAVHKEGIKADLSTISGSIKAYKPFDFLEFDTISGSVKVDTKESSSVTGSTISGGVTAILCSGCGYNANFDSVSGNFKDNYKNQKYGNEITITEGAADVRFDVDTISGNLKLENWE